MTDKNYVIRRERSEEERTVEELVRDAFWNVYRPGCLEHYLLHRLRRDPAFVDELDLVLESGGRIIGQVVFMRASIKDDSGRDIPIMTLGPICVAPDRKRRGLGKYLLDNALDKAAALGCGAVCLEGDIAFYGRSGFEYASGLGLRYPGLPEGSDASFFLCKELIPGYLGGVTGLYVPPVGYMIDEKEAEAFDLDFPPKEKLRLPGQLF